MKSWIPMRKFLCHNVSGKIQVNNRLYVSDLGEIMCMGGGYRYEENFDV